MLFEPLTPATDMLLVDDSVTSILGYRVQHT
jgi:hypothetical protein